MTPEQIALALKVFDGLASALTRWQPFIVLVESMVREGRNPTDEEWAALDEEIARAHARLEGAVLREPRASDVATLE